MAASRRRWLRIPLVLLALVVLAVGAVWLRGRHLAAQRYTVAPAGLVAVPADSAVRARGAHLASAFGCRDCHGEGLGGRVLADAPPFRLVSTNLTRGRGGLGAELTPDVMERALRHGVGHDGRPLWAMPGSSFRHLSDADVQALAAYVATVDPVDGDSGRTVLKPLGQALYAAGKLMPEVFPGPAPGPELTPADTGKYIADVACRHCHGADLGGAPHPDPEGPASPSLQPAARWTLAQFATALRTGERPSAPRLDPRWMPWTAFAALSEAEIAALHRHIGRAMAGASTP